MKLKVLNNSSTRENLLRGAMDDTYCFTIVAPPNKNNEISKVLIYPDYCRDSMIANIFTGLSYRKNAGILPALKGDRGHSYLMFVYKYNNSDYDDELKVLPSAVKQMNTKLKASVGVLNKIEAEAKWPRSRLIFPRHEWEDQLSLAVFKVTHNWFYSPYMFSMLVLILRAVLFTNIYKQKEMPDVKKLKTYFRERRQNTWSWSECSETKDYAARTIKHWISILKNFKAIHKGTDWEYNFKPSSYNQGLTNCHMEGILTLVDGRSSNSVIAHNYDEICYGE